MDISGAGETGSLVGGFPKARLVLGEGAENPCAGSVVRLRCPAPLSGSVVRLRCPAPCPTQLSDADVHYGCASWIDVNV